MEVTFRDKALETLKTNPKARVPFPAELVGRFKRVLRIIETAVEERDFYAFGRGLRYERLERDRAGQSSFRLNDQYRLIAIISGEVPRKTAEVIEVVDYHD